MHTNIYLMSVYNSVSSGFDIVETFLNLVTKTTQSSDVTKTQMAFKAYKISNLDHLFYLVI